MPKTLNTYPIPLFGEATIRHQRNAPVAHFGIIEGNAFLWVEEPEEPIKRRTNYKTIGTGQTVPDYWQYVTSTQDPITGVTAHLYKES